MTSTASRRPQDPAQVVEKATEEWANNMAHRADPRNVEVLLSLVRDTSEHPEYKDFGLEFVAAYHIVNFRKNLHTLESVAPPVPTSITDVGCGSGASTVAAIAYALSCDADLDELDIVAIDRSPSQLDLCRQALDHLQKSLGRVRLNVTYMLGEASESLALQPSNLVIASHVLTENPGHEERVLDACWELVAAPGHLVLIERQDDPVWRHVQEYLAAFRGDRESGKVEFDAPEGQYLPARTWRASWTTLARPHEHSLLLLVEAYFRAWQEQSVNLLVQVFAPDATYSDKPFGPVLVGRQAIEEYWRREVLTQEHPEVLVNRVSFSRNSALVEWSATFTRHQRRTKVAGAMVLEADSRRSRIVRLREYYRAEHTS